VFVGREPDLDGVVGKVLEILVMVVDMMVVLLAGKMLELVVELDVCLKVADVELDVFLKVADVQLDVCLRVADVQLDVCLKVADVLFEDFYVLN